MIFVIYFSESENVTRLSDGNFRSDFVAPCVQVLRLVPPRNKLITYHSLPVQYVRRSSLSGHHHQTVGHVSLDLATISLFYISALKLQLRASRTRLMNWRRNVTRQMIHLTSLVPVPILMLLLLHHPQLHLPLHQSPLSLKASLPTMKLEEERCSHFWN